MSVVHLLSCPVPSTLELINCLEWSMTCKLNSEKLLKCSGRGGGWDLSLWFAPHSKCASRCRLDGQEVRQHTFWTDFPWPLLGYLFSKDVFKGMVDENMGVSIPASSVIQIVSSHGEPAAPELGDRAGWWQVHVVVGFWAGGAGTVNLLTHHACLHNCQSSRPGLGWCARDVSCADYLGILVCLLGCPLCWHRNKIIASKSRQGLRIKQSSLLP